MSYTNTNTNANKECFKGQGPSLRDISRAKGNLKGVGSPTTSQVSVEYGHSVLVRSGIWHFEAWVGKGRESRVYRFGMGKEHG